MPSHDTPMKLIRIHYLDASAIVKLVIAEEGNRELRHYFGRESNFFTLHPYILPKLSVC